MLNVMHDATRRFEVVRQSSICTERESSNTSLLFGQVFFLLLLPVFGKIPIFLVFVFVFEPFRVVLELGVGSVRTVSTSSETPLTRSLPDMPELLPAAACASFAFLSASSAATF
jgi:hypothetical protein